MKRRPVAADLDQRLCIDDTLHCHHILAALLIFSCNIRHFLKLGNTRFQEELIRRKEDSPPQSDFEEYTYKAQGLGVCGAFDYGLKECDLLSGRGGYWPRAAK